MERPDAVATIDFGSSLTRANAVRSDRPGTQEYITVLMAPEVAIVDPEEIADDWSMKLMGPVRPENRAWVKTPDGYAVVGKIAKTQFFANSGLAELKYERAIAKTQAMVWAISQRLDLPNRFTLALSVLLPGGELTDGERLRKSIKSALRSFETPSGKLRVKLVSFLSQPEGYGLCLIHAGQQTMASLESPVAAVMMGFRNASILPICSQAIEQGFSSNLGFIRMVEAAVKKTSGLQLDRMTEAIVKAGYPIEEEVLFEFACSRSEVGRAQDVERMVKAIESSRRQYFRSLVSWLDNTLPMGTQDILFGGGTAAYFQAELQEYYQTRKGLTLWWHGGIQIPPHLIQDISLERLADCYCLFLYYLKKIQSATQMLCSETERTASQSPPHPFAS